VYVLAGPGKACMGPRITNGGASASLCDETGVAPGALDAPIAAPAEPASPGGRRSRPYLSFGPGAGARRPSRAALGVASAFRSPRAYWTPASRWARILGFHQTGSMCPKAQ